MRSRVDFRWLAQLVKDDGTDATTSEFDASQRVLDALEDASGIILGYALQGKRYSLEDLQTLADADLAAAGRGLLIRMNVDLAAALLAEARQIPNEDIAKTIPGYGRTMQFLQQLQLGNVIFENTAAARAGVPELAYTGGGSNVICHLSRLVGDVAFTEKQNNGVYPPCDNCGSCNCGGC